VATDIRSKKINMIPIILELYYMKDPRKYFDLLTISFEAAERIIYNEILEDLETIDLCRSRARWAREVLKWFSVIYRDKRGEELCERLFIDEATLLFQYLDQRIREIIDELNKKLDFVVYATEIKKIDIGNNLVVYISQSYASWLSEEKTRDILSIIDRNPFVL